MKNSLFYQLLTRSLIVVVIPFFIGCEPKENVIEKPVFITKNTQAIDINKVVLTDTTTVLDVLADGNPHTWIRIAGTSKLIDDQGNTYPLLSGMGIELDKELMLPESGKAHFQLVFPALKKKAKYIDFTEGDESDNAFTILGIQLKNIPLPETQLPKEVLEQQTDKNASMTEQPFSFGEATIKGKILDYRPGMPDYVRIISHNPLVGNNGYFNITLAPDGSFQHTLTLLGTSIAWVYYAGVATTAEIFVAPNQTSEIYFNIREVSRKLSKLHADSAPYGKELYYKGPLPIVVEEWPEAKKLLQEEYKFYDFRKAPKALLEEYKQNQIANAKQWLETINHSPLSKATKEYMAISIPVSLAGKLQQASGYLTQRYVVDTETYNPDKRWAMYDKFKKAYPKEYVSKELMQTLNNPSALFTEGYGKLVNHTAIMKNIETDGLFAELIKASQCYQTIKDFIPLNEEQTETIKTLSEPCRQYLEATNNDVLKMIENNKKRHGFQINEVGEVCNEDLFASIISKFRGKVILVDFWATWCGPCVAGHKAMHPLKTELKDKDIVYIYITGETSPKEHWDTMIPSIYGEHYRLTNEQWNYLYKTFRIKGIPTYLIIDREGNITHREEGFPGTIKMKEILLETCL